MNTDVPSVTNIGFFFTLSKVEQSNSEIVHLFCGENNTAPTLCLNCHNPFLRFVVLDTRDTCLGLKESDFDKLPLIFCWRCSISQKPFVYQIEENGNQIRIIDYEKGGIRRRFPVQ